ncbi:hypothetical protein DID80_02090, partial [Candidatus Marinamargulisbacteria bacterium SCGC AAA071-K20]
MLSNLKNHVHSPDIFKAHLQQRDADLVTKNTSGAKQIAAYSNDAMQITEAALSLTACYLASQTGGIVPLATATALALRPAGRLLSILPARMLDSYYPNEFNAEAHLRTVTDSSLLQWAELIPAIFAPSASFAKSLISVVPRALFEFTAKQFTDDKFWSGFFGNLGCVVGRGSALAVSPELESSINNAAKEVFKGSYFSMAFQSIEASVSSLGTWGSNIAWGAYKLGQIAVGSQLGSLLKISPPLVTAGLSALSEGIHLGADMLPIQATVRRRLVEENIFINAHNTNQQCEAATPTTIDQDTLQGNYQTKLTEVVINGENFIGEISLESLSFAQEGEVEAFKEMFLEAVSKLGITTPQEKTQLLTNGLLSLPSSLHDKLLAHFQSNEADGWGPQFAPTGACFDDTPIITPPNTGNSTTNGTDSNSTTNGTDTIPTTQNQGAAASDSTIDLVPLILGGSAVVSGVSARVYNRNDTKKSNRAYVGFQVRHRRETQKVTSALTPSHSIKAEIESLRKKLDRERAKSDTTLEIYLNKFGTNDPAKRTIRADLNTIINKLRHLFGDSVLSVKEQDKMGIELIHVIKSPEHLRLLLNKIDQATLISQDQQVVLERLAPHIIRNKTEFTRLVHEIVTGRPADNNLNKGNTLSWFFNGNLSNALVVDETKFLNFLTQKSHGTVDIFTDPYYTYLYTQNKGFFRPQYRR